MGLRTCGKGRVFHLRDGGSKKKHWLDSAELKYNETFVQGVKDVLNVGTLFLTYPMFYACFFQMGSRWTFQAAKMNGKMTSYVYMMPEQLQLSNTILVIVLVRLFDSFLYPCLGKAQ